MNSQTERLTLTGSAGAIEALRDAPQLAEGQSLHLQVIQEGDEYRITNIHQESAKESAPASGHAPEQAKDEMEGMNHSQHDMGAKP